MKDWENLDADVNMILGLHFSEGRGGKSVDKVVVHYNAGNLTVAGCYSVWQDRAASAHYQVESKGTVGQLVWDRDTAWHAGNFDQNQRSIGIEHANMSDGTITEACLDNGAHLTAAICKYYGLGRPEWLVNVFPHKYFQATSCPGQIYGSQKDTYIQRAQYWYDLMTGAIEPEPEPEPATPLPEVLKAYEDLDPDAWYIGPVEECVREGYMTGYDASHFGPSNAMTRGEAVCAISNAARVDLSEFLEPFKDVAPSPFYYTAVCWASENAVIAPLENFRPDDACTRAEFATMLCNWQHGEATETPTDYPDWADVPEWAQASMAWAVEKGVISGSDGKLLPNSACSRAEAAAMLANLL